MVGGVKIRWYSHFICLILLLSTSYPSTSLLMIAHTVYALPVVPPKPPSNIIETSAGCVGVIAGELDGM